MTPKLKIYFFEILKVKEKVGVVLLQSWLDTSVSFVAYKSYMHKANLDSMMMYAVEGK